MMTIVLARMRKERFLESDDGVDIGKLNVIGERRVPQAIVFVTDGTQADLDWARDVCKEDNDGWRAFALYNCEDPITEGKRTIQSYEDE